MRKKVLLICLVLLLVGCKKVENNDNYIEFVNDCLTKKPITNNVSLGYKYYIPKGIKKVKDYDYNQVFLVDDVHLYLYVDIISYHYQKELNIQKKSNAYYFENINYNGKKGYIEVVLEEDKYFLSIVYNYSKIEAYADKTEVNKIIILSSIILNSIEYNDKVIEKVLEGDFGQFSEFTYEVDKPEEASSNFSQFLEEYVQKEKKTEQLPDE